MARMALVRKILVVVSALLLLLVVVGLSWYFTNRIVVPSPTESDETDVFVGPGVDPETARQAGDRLTQLRLESSYPAVSASIAVDGVIAWSEAQGYADLPSRRVATIDTRLPIGSVSKPLTATGAMLLVERGRLDLDVDIRRYVPEFPEKTHPITARQLLSHQAGIRHYRLVWDPPLFSEMVWNVQYASIGESLQLFADDRLAFAPDTAFQYSTYGYTLLSAALEAAAGEPFLEYMQTTLFEPLSMQRTRPDDSTREQPHRASGYISAFGRSVLPAPPANSSNKWAGAGFVSTPEDLVRFGAALLDDRIVTGASRQLMFEPRRTVDGAVNAQNYGLGWRVGQMRFPSGSDELVRIVHHGGTSIGAQCAMLLVPDSRVVVAVSTNAYTGGSGELIQAAASIARLFMAAQDPMDQRQGAP